MRPLADTLVRLQAQAKAQARARQAMGAAVTSPRLAAFDFPGSNPGALSAYRFVPPDLAQGAGLVVALHGCTQTAADYDLGAGWSAMAQTHGFAVLLPEQRRANNPGLCFNWFSPGDVRRESGEALSIVQMITAMVREFDLDPARIFITGLSAGGAMAAAMLATYPELFAGGGVIAGVSFGAAQTMPEAFDRMRGRGLASDLTATARVREASDHAGPWPALTVFHGAADSTVDADNADALLRQWLGLHERDGAPDLDEASGRHRRRVWKDAQGVTLVEDFRVHAMGHGVPLDAGGEAPCGVAGPYMLDVGLCSTRQLIARWDLVDLAGSPRQAAVAQGGPEAGTPPPGGKAGVSDLLPAPDPVRHMIETALRTAGLMKS